MKKTDRLYRKTADYTLKASESGATFVADAADLTFTLPPTEEGLKYRVFVETPSATNGLRIDPASGDQIKAKGITAADDKYLENTAATDAQGDGAILVADGDEGWFAFLFGTWAREA